MSESVGTTMWKFVAPEFIFGCGAIALLPAYFRNLGGRKLFLATDEGIRDAGWVSKLERMLAEDSIPYTIFDGISSNPRDTEVAKGAELFLESGSDCIVALGGGSPMDCAKGIGILAVNGGRINDYAGVDMIPKPMPPLICIPTTAGTSADVSQFAIITDTVRKMKMAIVSKAVVPDAALIDPALLVTMNRDLSATTGVDALVHAFEAYVSLGGWSMTDIHAEKAVMLLGRYLRQTLEEPDNLEARTAVMEGSLQAGLAFSNASLGLVHAMAHSLGGFLDLPHGLCNALLLPEVVAFNFDVVRDKYSRLGTLLGFTDTRDKDAFIVQIRDFLSSLGLSGGLGLSTRSPEEIKTLSEFALRDACVVTNPVMPELEDIEGIYGRL